MNRMYDFYLYITVNESLLLTLYVFNFTVSINVVGPCHHGMARPQVADRGTASDKEGSCE